jgi:glycosyltransferase involved in cell wall biosynthesis
MLEAMREGVPVMGSNIPPHQQLLGSDRGVLFDAGNLDSCIRCLGWAIDHPETLATMAKKAQQHVQHNYSWDRITEDTLSLYKSVVSLPSSLVPSKYNSYR